MDHKKVHLCSTLNPSTHRFKDFFANFYSFMTYMTYYDLIFLDLMFFEIKDFYSCNPKFFKFGDFFLGSGIFILRIGDF